MTKAAQASRGVTLGEIGQIAVTVHDLERAVDFYRDRLGLPFLFSAPGLAFFQCGAVRLMLAKPERPEHDHPSSILYFRVDDVESAQRQLAARGVEFVTAPEVVHRTSDYELWISAFADGEGNTLALMAERRLES